MDKLDAERRRDIVIVVCQALETLDEIFDEMLEPKPTVHEVLADGLLDRRDKYREFDVGNCRGLLHGIALGLGIDIFSLLENFAVPVEEYQSLYNEAVEESLKQISKNQVKG